MDNRHMITPNSGKSPSHSINDLEDRIGHLNVNDTPSAIFNSGSPGISNQPLASHNEIHYSNLNSRATPSGNSARRLNPSAQEFVPRGMMSSPSPAQSSYSTTSNGPPINNHHLPNGNVNNSNQSSSILDGENDCEDYIALSYLKEFISSISHKPSVYDNGIVEITCIVNSYLDEDECVLELIVNQIVDQSIVDVNFRYNGVRICFHFMENLRRTSSGQTFKNILFKRCQRECSRKVSHSTSANTFSHLRGLALFTAELFSRSKEAELAEYLPKLMVSILATNYQTKLEENVVCVCQVLKLCGQQLDAFFSERGKDDVKNVMQKLSETTECDIPDHISNMAKNLIKLSENNWMEQPKAPTASTIKNPYQNFNSDVNDDNTNYYSHYNSATFSGNMYDFGGDEINEEVCNDFENFLRTLPD